MNSNDAHLVAPVEDVFLYAPTPDLPYEWVLLCSSGDSATAVQVEGTSEELADLLEKNKELVRSYDTHRPVVTDEVIERLRTLKGMAVGRLYQTEAPLEEEVLCPLGCGDGRGVLDIAYNVVMDSWTVCAAHGCRTVVTAHAVDLQGVRARLEDLLNQLEALQDLHGPAGDLGMRVLVSNALEQLG